MVCESLVKLVSQILVKVIRILIYLYTHDLDNIFVLLLSYILVCLSD